MKYFIISALIFVNAGCSNKLSEQVDYYNTPLPSKGFSVPTLMRPPLPPMIYVPSAPSQSMVIPARPNFIPVMPEESKKRLEMLLTNKR